MEPYRKGIWAGLLDSLDEIKPDSTNKLSRTDCILNALSSIIALETSSGENKLEIQRIFQEDLLDGLSLPKQQALEEYLYYKQYGKLLYTYR